MIKNFIPVFASKIMADIYSMADKIANSKAPVFIIGDTGTGKEMVANYIHYNSERKDFPFIAVNCAALPSELIESELFGHVKGAFTGASVEKIGLFQSAGNGTIFLDEIAEMSFHTQSKLLRVLQDRTVRQVGGKDFTRLSCRVIAATNIEPSCAIKEHKLREDLYYRLNVIEFKVPPLVERLEDIKALAVHFVDKYSKEEERNIKITDDALEFLKRCTFPGNVRELENLCYRALLLNETGILTEYDFKNQGLVLYSEKLVSGDYDLRALERKTVEAALKITNYNKVKAGKMLGVCRASVLAKMRRFRINDKKC